MIFNGLALGTYLQRNYSSYFQTIYFLEGQLFLQIRPDCILSLFQMLVLDEKLQFSQLLDVFGVDYPRDGKRFEVNYIALSLTNVCRVWIKSRLTADWTSSLSSLFPSAVWLEREVWDMMGIFFFNHPDLRRLLTDYGFDGFPLRKDFPLSGYSEVRYDEEKKKIVAEPLRLTQEFRYFDFVSPWSEEETKN